MNLQEQYFVKYSLTKNVYYFLTLLKFYCSKVLKFQMFGPNIDNYKTVYFTN